MQLTWCFARASSESTAIAGVANQAVRELRQPLSLQDLADLMWSCAKTQVREKALLQSFTQSFLSDGAAVSRCKPIELSNLAWSIVKLGLHEEQEFFLSELCRYSAEQMADFKPAACMNQARLHYVVNATDGFSVGWGRLQPPVRWSSPTCHTRSRGLPSVVSTLLQPLRGRWRNRALMAEPDQHAALQLCSIV